MSRPFIIGFTGAALLLAVLVAYVFESQRGNHLVPTGRILQVRTVPLDQTNSILIVDFEATNPSEREMVVRLISIVLHKKDGSTPDNTAVAASDMPTLFRYHSELGPIEHQPMRERDRIAPHQTVRASTAVRFDLPKAEVDSRRDVELVLEDITGPKLELTAQ